MIIFERKDKYHDRHKTKYLLIEDYEEKLQYLSSKPLQQSEKSKQQIFS